MTNRRDFIKKSAIGAAGVAVGAHAFSAQSYSRIMGANDRINIAVIGLRGRGGGLMNSFAEMHGDGVLIKTLCDVDSQFFDARIAQAAERQGGHKPGTENDMRAVFENKEIDAVVIATPNHWHAFRQFGHARQANMCMLKSLVLITYGRDVKWLKLPVNTIGLFRLVSKTVPSAM